MQELEGGGVWCYCFLEFELNLERGCGLSRKDGGVWFMMKRVCEWMSFVGVDWVPGVWRMDASATTTQLHQVQTISECLLVYHGLLWTMRTTRLFLFVLSFSLFLMMDGRVDWWMDDGGGGGRRFILHAMHDVWDR
jgi:hypothetical protein